MIILKDSFSNQVEAVDLMKLSVCQQSSLQTSMATMTYDVQLCWVSIVTEAPLRYHAVVRIQVARKIRYSACLRDSRIRYPSARLCPDLSLT